MTLRTFKLTVLGASIALLAACGGGGGDDGPKPSTAPTGGTPPVGAPPVGGPEPVTGRGGEIGALERKYEVAGDTTPIAARLRPEALDAVTWGDGAVPVANTEPRSYTPETSWTWQLLGDEIDTSYDANVYVLDLFAQLDGKVQAELEALGRDNICYFSVGTYEPWRPDRGFFEEDMLGNAHVAYGDERWLDPTDPRVLRIMVNRMDMAKAIGCDGVELDNVDGYENDSGWDITEAEATTYAKILANEAHARGLAVALKNVPAILPDVIDWFDLSINESCHHFNECGPYSAMIDEGKPVFNAEYAVWRDTATPYVEGTPEYDAALREVCDASIEQGLRTLLLPKALDGSSRLSCDLLR